MARDLNQCNFIGRLGQEVEIKYMPSGKAVCNISIACSDDYNDKTSGNKVEQTNWIRVVAFGRLAEIMGEYLRKGSQVFISGKQVTRKWQDQSGNDRYTTEIVANEMQMLGGKQGQATVLPVGSQSAATGQPQDGTQGQPQVLLGVQYFDDDIPF